MDNLARIDFEHSTKGDIKLAEEKEPKRKKDGTPKMSGGDRKTGKSSTVEPIRSLEDLQKLRLYFKEQLANSDRIYDKIRWARNYAIFVVGINTHLRISDILKLKWSDVMDENDNFYSKFRPKERKTKKFNLKFIHEDIQQGLTLYMDILSDTLDNVDKNGYIFITSKSKGNLMTPATYTAVLKNAVDECNIDLVIGTHSMRKTYCYHYLMNNKNNARALQTLCAKLNHSSEKQTLLYAGISEDEFCAADKQMSDFFLKVEHGNFDTAKDIRKISEQRLLDIAELIYQTGLGNAGKTFAEQSADYETLKDMISESFL